MWNCQQTQDNKTDPNHIGPSCIILKRKTKSIKSLLEAREEDSVPEVSLNKACPLRSV